jgi:hypothetical protein
LEWLAVFWTIIELTKENEKLTTKASHHPERRISQPG